MMVRLGLALVVVTTTASLAGAAGSVNALVADARIARSSGDSAAAVAADRAILARDSIAYVLAGGARDATRADLVGDTATWAHQLAKSGDIDRALAVLDGAAGTSLAEQRSAVLVDAATAAAARGDYAAAVLRLTQAGSMGSASVRAAVATHLPADELGLARQDLAAGDGVAAVTAADAALAAAPDPATAQATRALLPAALLQAGREADAATDHAAAVGLLNRLVNEYPTTAQARQARRLLAAPQTVSGTLVTGSTPDAYPVRLSSHFSRIGNGYITTGPFFYAHAGAEGDFTFASVPLGGPYILEVDGPQGWTTLLDPQTGRPADPVTVTALTPTDLAFIVIPG